MVTWKEREKRFRKDVWGDLERAGDSEKTTKDSERAKGRKGGSERAQGSLPHSIRTAARPAKWRPGQGDGEPAEPVQTSWSLSWLTALGGVTRGGQDLLQLVLVDGGVEDEHARQALGRQPPNQTQVRQRPLHLPPAPPRPPQ